MSDDLTEQVYNYLSKGNCNPERKWRLPLTYSANSIVVPNSNPLGIKRFVSGISTSVKCECHKIMQIQYTKNLNPRRFELGTTLS